MTSIHLYSYIITCTVHVHVYYISVHIQAQYTMYMSIMHMYSPVGPHNVTDVHIFTYVHAYKSLPCLSVTVIENRFFCNKFVCMSHFIKYVCHPVLNTTLSNYSCTKFHLFSFTRDHACSYRLSSWSSIELKTRNVIKHLRGGEGRGSYERRIRRMIRRGERKKGWGED